MSGPGARTRMRLVAARISELAVLACALLSPTGARAFTITATYDTSITNHPQAATIENTINSAIAQYQSKIQDPVNVTITFVRQYTGLGNSSWFTRQYRYADWLLAVEQHASSFDDAVAIASLPQSGPNPLTGNDSIIVSLPLARALGLSSAPQQAPNGIATSVLLPRESALDPTALRRSMATRLAALPQQVQASTDGTIYLDLDLMNLTTNPTTGGQYSLFAVASHEMDEVLGSASRLNGSLNGAAAPTGAVFAEDMFRYDVNGNRSFTTSATDSAFLALDGVHRLVRYNQTQGGDFSDWWSPAVTPRVQDAFQTPGQDPAMGVEWRLLDALGWSYGPTGVWVNFAYSGTQTGAFLTPFATLAQGLAACPSGGVIFLVGNMHSTETFSGINQAANITTVGGPATIGQ